MASAFSAARLIVALASVTTANAQSPPISEAPYPGTLTVSVDATDIARRIFTVHEEIPVSAGPLRLFYPQWLPGNHGPRGPIDQIGGLMFRVGDTPLNWRRDPLDVYSFLLEIPAQASKLQVDFQFLSPLDANQGRVVVTPEIIGLQWNTVILYPAGHAAGAITVQPELKLPDSWKFASALEIATQSGARTRFKPVDLDTLVDSPVLAGKYFRRFELAGSGAVPVHLDVVADAPKELEAKPEVLARHVRLVDQAYRVFGAPHYRHYDFLLAISARYAGIGLEHHQSSEDGTDPGYLIEPKEFFGRDLLAHEFTHSWNGKFRRGADLATANFNTPMQDSLLWVYEGQTQYWGNVLAARTGLHSAEQSRESLAVVAATYANREGRIWRNLQDTTNQPIISARKPQAWRSWQRPEDYYSEGQLIWLDADTLIREKSAGAKSLDDFARAFFGVKSDRIAPLPYVFEDVVAALNTVLPYDWSGFLRERLDGKRPEAPLDGLSRGGWKLVYNDQPNLAITAAEGKRKYLDLSYSLGLVVNTKDMHINEVLWNSAAFKAGLASSMTLVAVNGVVASSDALKDAIIDAGKHGTPIVLLVNNLEHIDTVAVDYRGGLRYPHLQRVAATSDRLTAILAERKAEPGQ